jgi:hypothetical protein
MFRYPWRMLIEKLCVGSIVNDRSCIAHQRNTLGKTFIAQAIGLHACARGKPVLYMTVTTWLENVALARCSGTYLRYRDKIANPDVLTKWE